MKIITNSEQETFEFARDYAKKLRGGEVIGLIGDLGAGKTIFTKGLAAELGIKENVNSPTFVLMKIYKIQNAELRIKNLVHIDAYRINLVKDIIAIGAEEYFNREDTVVVIEWADRIKKILPQKTRFLKININNNQRAINYDLLY